MRNVKVALGKDSYEIWIGEDFQEVFITLFGNRSFSKTALIVSDQNTASLYGDRVRTALQSIGFAAEVFIAEPGEHSKSLQTAEEIYTRAIEAGLDRRSPIIALGGGVVGDLAGFIAATYMRGVPFVQIPTSLLAQVDSSVGGKVAVNHPLGKNLIGAFYQPKGVLIDLAMLQTLPKREIYTGLAEVVKYGVIYDRDFFAYLGQNAEMILQLDVAAMAHVVARSCEIKAQVVSQDEKEFGLRIILNFGHTIAHAIESETGYALYNHGEAVAIGMYGAALLSQYMGLVSKETVDAVAAMLEKFHLPLRAKQCAPGNLLNILHRDKKAVNGSVQWVLLEEIGKVKVTREVPEELVRRVLREIMQP